MSERPYHKAMSLDAALGLLRQESSKALDPRVVQTFIDMYPTLAAEADASAEPSRKLTRVPTHAPTAAPAVGLVDESSPSARTNVFQDIALAHREIYALYEIAQAMGSSLGVSDTMALISSKLSNIVPFSCCALFLYNEETETLRCRFATGVEAETIQQLTIRNGHGLTGWVARNRRPLVNARPSTDLEAAGVPVRSHDAALGAGLPAAVQRALHRHDLRSTTPSRRSTPTIIAGCSTGFPSRPPPSSTTRSCSSRRRKIR